MTFCLFIFLGPHLWHVEVPRLGVQSELLQPAYARATATPDLRCVCDLYHSSRQSRIFNPLSKARDRTRNLMAPSQIRFHCAKMGTPKNIFKKIVVLNQKRSAYLLQKNHKVQKSQKEDDSKIPSVTYLVKNNVNTLVCYFPNFPLSCMWTNVVFNINLMSFCNLIF